MGGSSSKQEVKSKQPPKNYMNEAIVKEQAAETGKDVAILAYQRQKTDAENTQLAIKKRTRQEKQEALNEREDAL